MNEERLHPLQRARMPLPGHSTSNIAHFLSMKQLLLLEVVSRLFCRPHTQLNSH